MNLAPQPCHQDKIRNEQDIVLFRLQGWTLLEMSFQSTETEVRFCDSELKVELHDIHSQFES
jgi:hypothetical protein